MTFSPPLRRKPISHGTEYAYRFLYCRCVECKQANAAAARRTRASRKVRGVCATCSHPARAGKRTCLLCGAKASATRIAQMRKQQQTTEAS
jgi:hypothetical protein